MKNLITPELAKQLEESYLREIEWFKNHGIDYHVDVNDKTGQATPAHRAWVKSCEHEHKVNGYSGSMNFPLSRKMFILGYLKSRNK
jgi:hypothetical protein